MSHKKHINRYKYINELSSAKSLKALTTLKAVFCFNGKRINRNIKIQSSFAVN